MPLSSDQPARAAEFQDLRFAAPSSATHDDLLNVAAFLKHMARLQPYRRAVVYPHGRDAFGRVAYTHLTFQQLDRQSDHIAWGLTQTGINRGARTTLMVKPGLEFFALTFALFKIGAVPVMVDPGMGLGRMVACFREAGPEAFIGIPRAHVLRLLYPRFFRSVQCWITVGRIRLPGSHLLSALRTLRQEPFPIAQTRRDETAAILFTTGSTGPAKGVVYTHGIFAAQIEAIRNAFGISPGEIDLPTFPLFALFDPALGMTAVIPDMDPTRPARVNPNKIIEAVNNHGVSNMFASPALLDRVGRFGKSKGIRLLSLKRVISAGAPIMPANIARFSTMLSDKGHIYTGYGATEAMPVAVVEGREILSEARHLSAKGLGVCIGRPLEGVEARIIAIDDGPIADWSGVREITDGSVGEIVVKGPQVTRSYFRRAQADTLAKIVDGDALWHRMGDLGRRDAAGRLWFYGRKSQRVITAAGTLFTIPCEAVFNRHPQVFRSALVGLGKPPHQTPVICIETAFGGRQKHSELTAELLSLAAANELTRTIRIVLFPKRFPVDIRHNSKIFREKLALWAAKRLAADSRSSQGTGRA
jgi:acyl-CoA synthetase (AMP-forming)/AMP-acid ligase II